MKKSDLFINLTPLLDVMFILIFIFLINMVITNDSLAQDFEDKREQLHEETQEFMESFEILQSQHEEELQKTYELLSSLTNEIEELKKENMSLIEMNEHLDMLVNVFEDIIDEQAILIEENEDYMHYYDHQLQSVMSALATLIGLSKDELQDLFENATNMDFEEIVDMLEGLSNVQDLAETLAKMHLTYTRFNFMEVYLQSPNNALYINGQPTRILITRHDWSINNPERESEKVREIVSAIQKEINAPFNTLILFGENDQHVSWNALMILEKSLSEIERIYGSNQVSKAEFSFYKMRGEDNED